jgi:hypothetical protein
MKGNYINRTSATDIAVKNHYQGSLYYFEDVLAMQYMPLIRRTPLTSRLPLRL